MDYTDSLPDECLALIFKFLPWIEDRKNSSLVSHRWLRIEAQTRTRLALIVRSELRPFIPSIFNRFNSLTQLVLENYYYTSVDDSINDNDMILITSMCPNLTRLKLEACRQLTDSGMAVFSKNCNKLKEFSCKNCVFSDLGIFALLDNSTQLEVLDCMFSDLCNYPTDVKAPPNLRAAKSLKVIELWHVDNERLFEPLIIASKNLTSLTLIGGDGSWDRSLEMIPNDSCLVDVCLDGVNVSDVGLISVAQNCRALKKLWVGCEIGDEGLTAVGKHCVNLQDLTLYGVDASYVSLQVIATNCQNLVRLYLSRSDTITDVEMQCIADNCTALKFLYIEKCHEVSDKGIEAFALGCPNLAEIRRKGVISLNVTSDSGVQEHVEEVPLVANDVAVTGPERNCSWESRHNEYIETARSKVLTLGASRDIVCVGSTKRLGASVDEFRYANRLVMFKAPPVGNPQCSQLPSMKSI
ncbi:F-box family protein [Artemisia annua]|uniref:F-box family protein n=1 Tax=Artemisia annua TaxID=35608 RepID=A0A2U1MHP1_ARTAN|nr:F-box family protein [Artemisia annua]